MKTERFICFSYFLILLLTFGCGQKKTQQEGRSVKGDESQMTTHIPKEGDGMGTVQNGSVVLVDYVGTLTNGDMFDTSLKEEAQKAEMYNPQRTYQPIQVNIGQRQVIPGFEEALMGMKVGESKTVAIPPEKAYGAVDDKLVQNVPLSVFKNAGMEPEAGKTVQFQSRDGRPLSALIREVNDDSILVDMNHPLAGETLHFRLTVSQILQNQ